MGRYETPGSGRREGGLRDISETSGHNDHAKHCSTPLGAIPWSVKVDRRSPAGDVAEPGDFFTSHDL